jgi:pilus assembly protein CpaF
MAPSESLEGEASLAPEPTPPDTPVEATPGADPAAPPLGEFSAGGSANPDGEGWAALRRWLASQITRGMEGEFEPGRTATKVQLLRERFELLCQEAELYLEQPDREELFQQVVDEVIGYGPIDPLLRDGSVNEVMVNGPHQVYVERQGKMTLTCVQFGGDEDVMRVIDRIIRPLGRRVDRRKPMVDARLPDGSRVNAIIPPCAIDGPSITIRKFAEDKLTMDNLLVFGSASPEMAKFLEACVMARLNVVVSGGTGSGKTTLLNILSAYIPPGERIVTIEDSAELQLQQPHVVRLETQPADMDGSGEVRIRDLVRNTLRMRPDRIVVGEVRGGEALDMLQAMNTGHDGSLTTAHANSPRDALTRLETMCLMAGLDIPLMVIRRQIASAVDLIVHQARLRDGSRKIVNITEVQGMEGEVVVMQDIFAFQEQGVAEDGKVLGEMVPSGMRPRFSPRLEKAGFSLPPEMFLKGDAKQMFSRMRLDPRR